MKPRLLGIAVLVAALLALPTLARGDAGQEAFAKGNSLLQKGDLNAALAAFATAARTDLDNEKYRQQYALVRRIVDLRKQLAVEKDPQRWDYFARALHAFYLDQSLHSEALLVARGIHAKAGTASSAAMLAETELALNNNKEAAQMLGALDKSKATPLTQALLGIALARLGNRDEAGKLAKEISLSDSAGPQTTYATARLHALVGNQEASLAGLARCFESLPPSRLENFKAHAKTCPDFARLASTPVFAQVMKTESKVTESQCSGGSSCAGCPMRAKCAKPPAGQGQ